MLTDTMTYEEVVKELAKDEKLLSHKLADAGKKITKRMRTAQNRNAVYYPPIEFKSSRGFNWVIQFVNYGLDFPSKKRLNYHTYAWYNQNKRMYFVDVCPEASEGDIRFTRYTVYTSHFVERYKERFLKDSTIKKTDAFHHFILNNNIEIGTKLETTNVKYPDAYWEMCDDGLCLCQSINNSIILARTFITWGMAHLDQQQFASDGQKYAESLGLRLDINLPDEDEDL